MSDENITTWPPQIFLVMDEAETVIADYLKPFNELIYQPKLRFWGGQVKYIREDVMRKGLLIINKDLLQAAINAIESLKLVYVDSVTERQSQAHIYALEVLHDLENALAILKEQSL